MLMRMSAAESEKYLEDTPPSADTPPFLVESIGSKQQARECTARRAPSTSPAAAPAPAGCGRAQEKESGADGPAVGCVRCRPRPDGRSPLAKGATARLRELALPVDGGNIDSLKARTGDHRGGSSLPDLT